MLAGSTITLTLQPADKQTVVPDFTGLTVQQVKDLGHHMTFSITFQTAKEYVTGSEGKVVSQSVAAKTSVATGSAIVLTVGPPAAPGATAGP
jgi:beta-lactam-binding protein with PASTA domain